MFFNNKKTFGKSDPSFLLLLPAYRQKLKCEAPALRTIQCWPDQSDAILQDYFDHVDWDMFQAASDDDIEAYSDSVRCFIRKCIEDVVSTKIICIYPNQKPWINSDVRSALSARTSAFKYGNTDSIKSFCSPDLEFHMLLCRPFWLPREFTAIIVILFTFPLKPTQTRHSRN